MTKTKSFMATHGAFTLDALKTTLANIRRALPKEHREKHDEAAREFMRLMRRWVREGAKLEKKVEGLERRKG